MEQSFNYKTRKSMELEPPSYDNYMREEVGNAAVGNAAVASNERPPAPPNYDEINVVKMTSEFMQTTTAHGLARIAAARTRSRRVFWVLVLVGAILFFGYQLTLLLFNYFSYPIVVNTRIEHRPVREFPAVTICNINMMKRDLLFTSPVYRSLAEIDWLLIDGNNGGEWVYNTYGSEVGSWEKTSSGPEYHEVTHVGLSTGDAGGSDGVTHVGLSTGDAGGSDGVTHVGLSTGDVGGSDEVTQVGLSTGNVGGSDVVTHVGLSTGDVGGSDGVTHVGLSTGDIGGTDVVTHVGLSTGDVGGSDGVTHVGLSTGDVGGSDEVTHVGLSTGDVGGSDEVTHVGLSTGDVGGSDGVTHVGLSTGDVGGSDEVTHVGLSTGDVGGSDEVTHVGLGTWDGEGSGEVEGPDMSPLLGISRWKRETEDNGEEFPILDESLEDSGNDDFDSDEMYLSYDYEMYMEMMSEFMGEFSFSGMTNENDWDEFLLRATTTDLSDLVDVYKPNMTELEMYGTQANEFIIQCSFDKKNCSHRCPVDIRHQDISRNFTQTPNGMYGMCYTFNHGERQPVITTSKYGSRYGLRLTLYIDRDNYVGMFSHRVGVVVGIHSYDVTSFPQDTGIVASPGKETIMGIRREEVTRQAFPYPSNCSSGEGISLRYDGNYTVTACSLSCLQRHMYSMCGCVDQLIGLREEPRCSVINATQEGCRQFVYYLYDENELNCNCPPACSEVNFHATVSSAEWPSESFLNILRTYQVAKMEDDGVDLSSIAALSDDQKLVQNVVRIQIYLQDQTVGIIEELPAYPWERLVADLGGLLGLFLGISICSAVELLEFCMDMCMACRRKQKQRNRVESVASIDIKQST